MVPPAGVQAWIVLPSTGLMMRGVCRGTVNPIDGAASAVILLAERERIVVAKYQVRSVVDQSKLCVQVDNLAYRCLVGLSRHEVLSYHFPLRILSARSP